MTFGVTSQGFRPKRLEDIQSETRTAWLNRFGANFDLDIRTPAGQIKEILDERMVLLWELAEAVYFSQYPTSAEGVALDNAVKLTGTNRQAATKSTVSSGRGFGTLGTIIPAGTIIHVNGNDASQFETDADTEISDPAENEVQTLSFDNNPTTGAFELVFSEGTTVDINWNDDLATITTKIETVLGSGNILVTGAIDEATGLTFEYQGTLANTDRAEFTVIDNTLVEGVTATITTVATTTDGHGDRTPLMSLTAVNTGPVVANAGTLTEIDTAVVGLDSFTNEEDAVLGRNRETDAELKSRQTQEVAVSGAATLPAIFSDISAVEGVSGVSVFENNTFIEDLEGRPPKTVDVVVQGGDEDDIANALFNTVAGGIGYFGDISKVVTDSEGFPHTVKFSRPVAVPIYVEIDLNTDPLVFPAGGLTAVRDAIVAYGANLVVGQDIIVFGSDPSLSCAFQSVAGITDFAIRVGKTASPTLDNNVAIGPREIAQIDVLNVSVAVV